MPARSSYADRRRPLLEWDGQDPSFDEVHREALKAKKYLQAVREKPVQSGAKKTRAPLIAVRDAAPARIADLQSVQRQFATAVMRPLNERLADASHRADGRAMVDVAAEFIKPNDRLTSFERIEL